VANLLGPVYHVYSWYLWRQVKNRPMPKHVGIILDGNRRFARQVNMDPTWGHEIGAKRIDEVLDWCFDAGIKVVTIFAFSTENFSRSKREVTKIMELAKERFESVARSEVVHRHRVRVRAIGRLSLLPPAVLDAIRAAEATTAPYDRFHLNVAIGYGGRAEIVDAVRRIAQEVKDGKIQPNDIRDSTIEDHLYTAGIADPDLVIRTSGEERLSGFLLWQSAYSELYFADVFWPEIRKIDFWRALRTLQQRERRFGK
jgi:tritrans,polycis-undecaprenyl-diphosphate synthase [geranylgeranyl-diphosphate specific]